MGYRQERTGPKAGSTPPIHRGALCRLARDRSGNVIAIMAMALIPLAGLVGGAVDLSRLYLTKTRLQQACDAGALAGRKVMGGGLWSADSYAARTAAQQFFDGNFKWDSGTQKGAYGSLAVTRSFSESQGKVTGTASAQVPMTVMKIFRQATKSISVTCDAEMRLPNTDVMFVLDTTYSMTETIPGDSVDKIVGLKRAVKCFYEILQRVNTTEACPAGDPSGGVSSQVQIRFGFMPYASNVNVGKLLPTTYFADSWVYSTRKAHLTMQNVSPATYNNGTASVTSTSYTGVGSYSAWVNDGAQTNGPCGTTPANTFADNGSESAPYNQQTTADANQNRVTTWQTSQAQIETDYQLIQSGSGSNRKCQRQKRTRNVTLVRNYSKTDTVATWNQELRPNGRWSYGDYTLNISGLKNGTSWNSSIEFPIGSFSGSIPNVTINNKTVTWDGCIEERTTMADPTTANFATMLAGQYDLNIDLAPIAGNQATMWAPLLNGAVYARAGTAEQVDSTTNYSNPTAGALEEYSCPVEAKKLQAWPAAPAFETYVNSLTPASYTYHDIGLLWGARFMSPTGIFAAENAFTPQGGEIERHLIFMTDGQACSKIDLNNAYGIPRLRRNNANFTNHTVTNQDIGTSTNYRCSTDADGGGPLTNEIIDRYTTLCEAVKNKNITLWVIYFGSVAAADRTRMQTCATDSRFYEATNTNSLITTFATIAAQISALRLTT